MAALYHEIPKEINANLNYRDNVRVRCHRNPDLQTLYRTASSRDILFWINTFLWTCDQRGANVVPWITWKFQDKTVLRMESHLLRCMRRYKLQDLAIKKSRDMGATWMNLAFFLHRWLFRKNESFLMASRTADLVDKAGDTDCLFWKIDFMLSHLPKWMKPRYLRTEMRLTNLDRGGTLSGSTTTADIGRGGRRTAILFDEFASDQNGRKVKSASNSTTYCRIFNSTPRGTATAFADVCRNPKTNLIELHWTLHPWKNKGLYRKPNGKLWSPWAEETYAAINCDWEWNQEFEMSEMGSAAQFFDEARLDELEKRDCMPPWQEGELDYNLTTNEPIGFEQGPGRPVKLWTYLDERGSPPADIYTMGLDVAEGTGASDSCISVASKTTGEKVLEYAINTLEPHEFACLAVAVAKWFGNAFMIWEATGPGRSFGKRVVEILGYQNVFMRQDEGSLKKKPSLTYGWWPTPENKGLVLRQYKQALGVRFINRSVEAIKQAREYVYTPGTAVVTHASEVNTKDANPSGARSSHGDRVIADALAYKGMEELGLPATKDAPVPVAVYQLGSLGWFREQAKKENADIWL